MSFGNDRVNQLIYQYLLESGLNKTAETLKNESHIKPIKVNGSAVRHSLVDIIESGLKQCPVKVSISKEDEVKGQSSGNDTDSGDFKASFGTDNEDTDEIAEISSDSSEKKRKQKPGPSSSKQYSKRSTAKRNTRTSAACPKYKSTIVSNESESDSNDNQKSTTIEDTKKSDERVEDLMEGSPDCSVVLQRVPKDLLNGELNASEIDSKMKQLELKKLGKTSDDGESETSTPMPGPSRGVKSRSGVIDIDSGSDESSDDFLSSIPLKCHDSKGSRKRYVPLGTSSEEDEVVSDEKSNKKSKLSDTKRKKNDNKERKSSKRAREDSSDYNSVSSVGSDVLYTSGDEKESKPKKKVKRRRVVSIYIIPSPLRIALKEYDCLLSSGYFRLR